MPEQLDTNQLIKSEVDELLKSSNFLQILSKYGVPLIVGSYAYNLMVWKDFDVNLKLNNFDNQNIYSLASEIAKALNPVKLQIHNHILSPQEGRPQGIWIGIYLLNGWKIDLWLLNEEEANIKRIEFEKLYSLIQNANKLAILEIKKKVANHPDYHKKFSSVDIYNSVANDRVENIEDFQNWLSTKKGLKYVFEENLQLQSRLQP